MNEHQREPAQERSERKELWAILLSVLSLVFGLVVLWLTRTVMDIEGDAEFLALLIVPIIVYTIGSGRVKELTAPGGWKVVLAKVADERITPATETVAASVQAVQGVRKMGLAALDDIRRGLDEAEPVTMKVVLDGQSRYSTEDMLSYIDALSQFPRFNFVVFLDNSDEFIAYMTYSALKGLLSSPWGDPFIDAVNAARLQDLFRYPGVVRDTLSPQSTNREALREMTRLKLEALVMIDDSRRLRGIIERDQVLGRMMLALTE